MKTITADRKIQLYTAVGLVMVGAGLLVAGFIVAPRGEIHSSVLIGFGEVMTFAGAVFGIDYTYKYKHSKIKTDNE
ncbi:MAG: hypothetical protein LUD76_06615 [Alistipes sp.]|nr:hypothetical protein [Alistipes sp.]MCD8173116.1 hypothetical protein [Alistipes sp.]